MADTCDVIVIGAGHNGLALAGYLAKAGQSVIVLERRDIIGGGVISEELIPGFIMNTHAMNHHWLHIGPVYKDLELEQHGCKYVFPPIISSHLWKDGKSITVYRDVDDTAREIAQFSERDAKSYKDWVLSMKDAFNLFAKAFFSPPLPMSEVMELYEALPNGQEVQKYLFMSMVDVADELFEHERTKTFFLGYCLQTLNHYGTKGSGAVPITLIVNQHLSTGNATCIGGAGTLTQAMTRFLKTHGGEVITNAHVSEVILEGDRAVGVRLENGDRINARTAIASNVEPGQLMLELVGEETLDEDYVRKVKNFQWNYFGMVRCQRRAGRGRELPDRESQRQPVVQRRPRPGGFRGYQARIPADGRRHPRQSALLHRPGIRPGSTRPNRLRGSTSSLSGSMLRTTSGSAPKNGTSSRRNTRTSAWGC